MDEKELEEQFEFLNDLRAMDKIITNIFWTLATKTYTADYLKSTWFDIKVFGTEPVFTSLLFDTLQREHDNRSTDTI